MSRKKAKLLEEMLRAPNLRPSYRRKLERALAGATRTGAGSELQIPMGGFDPLGPCQIMYNGDYIHR